MRFQEVDQMIASIGLPYAYYQFPQGTEQAAPFICFFYGLDNDFIADNTNYAKIEQLSIELYQDFWDDETERRVEAALGAAGMVYTRERVVIDSEKLFETIYTTEVLINA